MLLFRMFTADTAHVVIFLAGTVLQAQWMQLLGSGKDTALTLIADPALEQMYFARERFAFDDDLLFGRWSLL